MSSSIAPGATTPPPSFATFKDQPLADLCALAKGGYVRAFGAIVTATEKAVANIKTDSKVCAALQRAHVVATSERRIPPTSFKKFHEANAGGEAPGRVMALANVFLTLVDHATPMLTEAQFDAAPAAWLESASTAINLARKSFPEGDLHGSDLVKQTVAALTSAGDAGKTINALLKKQKGEKKTDAPAPGEPSENGNFIAPDKFVEQWVRQSPDNLRAMIQLVGAELSGLTATNEVPRMAAAMQVCAELMEGNPLFTAHFEAELTKSKAATTEKRADVTNVRTVPTNAAKAAKAAKPAPLTSLAEIPADLAAAA